MVEALPEGALAAPAALPEVSELPMPVLEPLAPMPPLPMVLELLPGEPEAVLLVEVSELVLPVVPEPMAPPVPAVELGAELDAPPVEPVPEVVVVLVVLLVPSLPPLLQAARVREPAASKASATARETDVWIMRVSPGWLS